MSEVALPAEDWLPSKLGVETTMTTLTLPSDISYDDYELMGAFIGRVHDMSKWWLADWLRQGEMLFGDKIYQAAIVTGRAEQTLRNYASIANNVPRSVRTDKLSFSHHDVIRRYEPEDQRRWLRISEEEDLTVAELRGRVRAERNGTPDITAEDPVCKCCGRPLD